MTARVGIREARAEDHAQLLPLARELATSYEVDPAAFSAALTGQVNEPSSLVLVAEQGPDLVGYALAQLHGTFHANGSVVWVEEVMVDSRHRSTGVGRALMNEIEEWAGRHDAAYVALATRRAAAFYQALGYEPSATYFKRVLSPEL